MPKAYGRQGFQTLTLFKTSNRSFRCPSAAAFRSSYKINYFFAEKLASWNKIFWKNCWYHAFIVMMMMMMCYVRYRIT